MDVVAADLRQDVEYPRAIWMPACALVEKHAQRASKYTTELFFS